MTSLLRFFHWKAISGFSNRHWGTMLVQSLLMAGTATFLCLLIGYPFAYIVARAGKEASRLMLMLVMIPFWTNTLIRTYAMVAVLKADGILNKTLIFLGLIDAPIKIMYTQSAVFIGLVYTLLPFMILPLYAAIEKLDQRLLESARDLGAGRWLAFRKITIPLTMPGIVSGCMLVISSGTWNVLYPRYPRWSADNAAWQLHP